VAHDEKFLYQGGKAGATRKSTFLETGEGGQTYRWMLYLNQNTN